MPLIEGHFSQLYYPLSDPESVKLDARFSTGGQYPPVVRGVKFLIPAYPKPILDKDGFRCKRVDESDLWWKIHKSAHRSDSQQKYPYPIWDYHDKAKYYVIRSQTNPLQWAWEFLRRNEAYQKACDAHLEKLRRTGLNHSGLLRAANEPYWNEPTLLGSADYREFFVSYELINPIANERQRHGKKSLTNKLALFAIEEQFGIDCMAHPMTDYSIENHVFRDVAVAEFHRDFSLWDYDLNPPNTSADTFIKSWKTMDSPPRKAKPNEATITFDLTKPISPQISQALEHLKIYQKRLAEKGWSIVKPKPQIPKKWADYLRALDALSATQNRRKVSEILFGESNGDTDKKTDNYLSAARELCESGYREIAAGWSPIENPKQIPCQNPPNP
jgi:hypothetical protein